MAAPQQINSTTTGTTAKAALSVDHTRQTLMIQNHSDEDMWFNFLGTAAVDAGFKVKSGETAIFAQADFPMVTNALSVVSATSGSKYSLTEDVN